MTMSCKEQLSRRDCTPVWLCYTTVVVNDPPHDTELERLLAQLLMLVSPALTGGPGPQGLLDGAGREDPQVTAAGNGAVVSPSEARALIELRRGPRHRPGGAWQPAGPGEEHGRRLAAGLERKGWIRRGRDEGNQRYVRLYLTSEGGAIAAQLWRAWQSRQARILRLAHPGERAACRPACAVSCAAWPPRESWATRNQFRPPTAAASRAGPSSAVSFRPVLAGHILTTKFCGQDAPAGAAAGSVP